MLQKLKIELKNLQHRSDTIALGKECYFSQKKKEKKKAEINKTKERKLNGLFSETTYVCGLLYQFSSFYYSSNMFF